MQTIISKIERRLRWYKGRFQVNNPVVGRAVEWCGNKVRMDGLTYSVNTPQITRGHKSTLAFGLHEMEERELIRQWLPPDVPVIEIGGGLGVVSCLTNKKLHNPACHIVVEANPAMVNVLRQNRDLNNCKFEILNLAVAYDQRTISLNVHGGFVGSTAKTTDYIEFGSTVNVRTISVEGLLDNAGFAQAGLVCDIEGIEVDIVHREFRILGDRIRFLMMETHPRISGSDAVDEMLEALIAMGFSLRQRIGDCVFFSR